MSVKSSFRSGDDELDRLVGLGITRQQVESGDDCLDCLDPEVLASYADGGLSEAARAEIDNHLARCRDCRRALALLLESDVEAPSMSPLSERHPDKADDWRGATSRSRILHSAKIWLPLAAALVVATGLWVAFDRSRQFAGSTPAAMLNARNESSAATQPAPQEGAALQRGQDGGRPSASTPASGLAERGAAPAVPPPAGTPLSASSSAAAGSSPADSAATLSATTQERESARGASAASAPAPAPAPNAAFAAGRAREARRDGFVAARPEPEADGRYRGGAPARPTAPAPPAAAAPPPPPPPPAALADASPARSGVAAGRDAQAAGARAGAGAAPAVGQVAGQVAPSPAQAPAAPPAQDQTVVDATQAKQAAQANQAPQNVTQQAYVANQQQTGPMANMNVASPPPSKTDDRRQAEASKREANDKTSAGAPSSAKSADEKFAKVAEEPKAAFRAKAAPESAAAAAPAESAATKTATTTTAKAEPSSNAAGASASGGKAAGAPGRAGAAAPESTSAAASPDSARAADRSTAGAGDTATREINEAVTITTTGTRATSAVLRSVDGRRWWRIRVPGTIEGSVDRGATWTVEYSEPLSVIVRGAAGSKSGCWMIGRRGLVLRARPDGGWEQVKQPTANGLVMVTATDHLIAAVTDDRGRTYRTNDGGVSWR